MSPFFNISFCRKLMEIHRKGMVKLKGTVLLTEGKMVPTHSKLKIVYVC